MSSLTGIVEQLYVALADAFDSLGLPVIDRDAEAQWALVQPVSQALRDSGDVFRQRSRSARTLDVTRQQLLSAAVAVADPAAHAVRQSRHRHPSLPIVVPGPDGTIPSGVIDCALEAGTRTVRWYPDGSIRHGELLPVVAGRPPEIRYRWQDRGVWDQLALDLIIVCCGCRTAPTTLPPVLTRARQPLGNQLRRDISVGTWTLQPTSVVSWLEESNIVTVYIGTVR